MSVCTTDGWVSVFWFETVGNDSSSATNGSSITIVAGKKRDPAKPWANAPIAGKTVSTVARASLAQPFELTVIIEGVHLGREQAIGLPRLVRARQQFADRVKWPRLALAAPGRRWPPSVDVQAPASQA